MNAVVVRRRLGRQFLMLGVALFLAIAAYDIVAGHWLSSAPERDEDTNVMTSRGLSAQRTDYLWGAVLGFAAAGLGFAAAGGLLKRQPVIEIGDEGLRLRIDGPNGFVSIPWTDVKMVRSGSDGADELIPTRVLLVNVADPASYPQRLWGAEWDGSTLRVDADSWAMGPEDVATRAQLAIDAWHRTDAESDEPTTTADPDAVATADPDPSETPT